MIFKRGEIPFFRKQKAVGAVRTHAQIFDTGMGTGGGISGSSFNSFQGGYGGSYQNTRFNPVWDRLEEGSIIEDWMPRDAAGLDKMFRIIYARDISGTVVDLIASLLWSDFELQGVKDKGRLKVYMDTMDSLKILDTLPNLTREFLTLGRSVNSMIFDSSKGIFSDWIPQDPDFVRLTPLPIKGLDPKIDLMPSPSMKQFLTSQDPRDIAARKQIPKEYLSAMMAAGSKGVPLSPLTTLYLPRRVSPYDHLGTSFLTRIVPFWALEKALLNSTMAAARRRTRAILHITAGLENLWEPTAEEIENIASMFVSFM